MSNSPGMTRDEKLERTIVNLRAEIKTLRGDFRDASGGISAVTFSELRRLRGRDYAREAARDFRELHSS